MTDLRKAAETAIETLLDPKSRADQVADAVQTLRQALDDKPPVKSYCGGKPNYCTPQPEVCCGEYARCLKVCIPKERWFAQQKLNVDAVNMTPDRVDETAKREQEPVAWMGIDSWGVVTKFRTNPFGGAIPLYKTPPKKEWVGLTDEERKQIVSYINDPFEWSHAIEAKLKEKNT